MAKHTLAELFGDQVPTKGGQRVPMNVEVDMKANTIEALVELPEAAVEAMASSEGMAEYFGTNEKGNSSIASARVDCIKTKHGTVTFIGNLYYKPTGK